MGWQKQILRVDLSKGTTKTEPLNMEWANAYLGERGLATKYHMENMKAAGVIRHVGPTKSGHWEILK